MEKTRDELYASLLARRPTISQRQGWYTGDALPRPISASREEQVFRRFERQSKGNFLGVAADLFATRLRVTSIQDDDTGAHDQETWQLLKASHARRDIKRATLDALVSGYGYLLVLPHARLAGLPTVRHLDPQYVATLPREDDPNEDSEALVVSIDRAQHMLVRLYTSSEVTTWRSPTPAPTSYDLTELNGFQLIDTAPHGFNGPPIARLGDGTSIIERGVPYQISANQSLLHKAAIERAQSFRKTTLLGYETEYDADGKRVPPALSNSPARVDAIPPNPTDGTVPQIHQTTPTSGNDLQHSVESSLQLLAGACGVPFHFLLPTAAASVSGDVLAASDQAYRGRLEELGDIMTEGLDLFLALLRQASGLPPKSLSIVYRTTLPTDISKASDGLLKAVQAGVPLRKALIETGIATPEEAETIVASEQEQSLISALSDAADAEDSAPVDGHTS